MGALDEGFYPSSSSEVDEEVSQNRVHFEDKLLVIRSPKVTDYKEHSLTTEERDDIIRKYNTEHSHLRESSDVVNDSEQSDMSVTDSDDFTDELEGMEPMEKLTHLLGELAEVGNITSEELNTGLYILASYVKGSTLSLLLDSCDMTIHDIEDDIASIGGFDRILMRNPKFSDDDLEVQEGKGGAV